MRPSTASAQRSILTLTAGMVGQGPLILVNRRHSYDSSEALPGLVALESNPYQITLERRYTVILRQLLEEVGATNRIVPVSGFRSYREQAALYASCLADNGEEYTANYVAWPGHSEHHTGLAVDLALDDGSPPDPICPNFPYDGICGRFRAAAPRFGLIERYPADKQSVTGIAHEPWHFRYVGAPHAEIMALTGDTLEEYHERLRCHRYGRAPLRFAVSGGLVEVSYLPAGHEPIILTATGPLLPQVSGNNIDGFIIAVWQEFL